MKWEEIYQRWLRRWWDLGSGVSTLGDSLAEAGLSLLKESRRLRSRLWFWLYLESRKRLPKEHYDEVWKAYIAERLEELRGTHGDEFVLWVSDTGAAEVEWGGREARMPRREVRLPR